MNEQRVVWEKMALLLKVVGLLLIALIRSLESFFILRMCGLP